LAPPPTEVKPAPDDASCGVVLASHPLRATPPRLPLFFLTPAWLPLPFLSTAPPPYVKVLLSEVRTFFSFLDDARSDSAMLAPSSFSCSLFSVNSFFFFYLWGF
jgi:hypothetical protein